MLDDEEFSHLFERVRSGDADAACVIVRRYEQAIRMAIRTRLTDPAMRRQFDSIDVCQSVLGSFFLHAATGAYDLHEPRQLVALLIKMAQNKLAMHVRRHYRECRDVRSSQGLDVEEAGIASSTPDSYRQAAAKELLRRALDMMPAETRSMAQRRMDGHSWSDIASSMGGTADGRRMQYQREIDRVADVLDVRPVGG